MKTLLVILGAAAVGVLAAWLLDMFTLAGVAAALWPWADTTGLLWPLGTRLAWWLLVLEVIVAAVMVLIHREGRLECPTMRDLWMAAHVSLVQRLWARGRRAYEGVVVAVEQHRRHRAVEVAQPVTASTEPRDAAREERAA